MTASCVSLSKGKESDAADIHSLLVKSTKGNTELTIKQLAECLVEPTAARQRLEIQAKSKLMAFFEIHQLTSNLPALQAYVARSSEARIIGHLIFHDFYSPWLGHNAYIDNVYIDMDELDHDSADKIQKKLVDSLIEQCRQDKLQSILFSASTVDEFLMKRSTGMPIKTLRDRETDWSVLRISFDDK